MSKISKISIASLASLSLAFSVFAQSPSPTPLRQQVRDTMREGMTEIREMRQEGMDAMRDAREESVDRMKEARENLQDRIEAKRAELKVRLQRIKDERKKQVVERIDKNLDAINKRMTDHFVNALGKLEDILVRIGERTDRAQDQGIDVASVNTAIIAAQEVIKVARAAVEAQAAKTYTIVVNTETGLKSDVGKVRQALHADLRVVFEAVKKARDAVHEAARAFAKVHGRDLPTPTLSPTVSPSPTPTPTP